MYNPQITRIQYARRGSPSARKHTRNPNAESKEKERTKPKKKTVIGYFKYHINWLSHGQDLGKQVSK